MLPYRKIRTAHLFTDPVARDLSRILECRNNHPRWHNLFACKAPAYNERPSPIRSVHFAVPMICRRYTVKLSISPRVAFYPESQTKTIKSLKGGSVIDAALGLYAKYHAFTSILHITFLETMLLK